MRDEEREHVVGVARCRASCGSDLSVSGLANVPFRTGSCELMYCSRVPALCSATILRCGVGSLLSLVCLAIPACVTVNPDQDYQRAAGLIVDRTGADDVYDPKTEYLIADKVAAALADGLAVDEAVAIALLNNRGFQSAFQDIGVSRADLVESGLISNPTLGLSLRFPEGGGLANLSLSLAQQLADLWQIPVRKRIAQAQLEQTLSMVVRAAVVLSSDVQVCYYRLLALERAATLAGEDLRLAGRSLALARSRFEAGESDKLDVNLARAGELEARRRMIALGQDVRQARSDLARVLGLSRQDADWPLTEELPTEPTVEVDEATLLTTAMTRRLDARAAAMQVQAAEEEVRRQVLDIFPNVTLGVEGERPERRAMPGRTILADTARASLRSGRLTAPDIQTRGERRRERSQVIDMLLGPTLDITLPIWHQNQPQIARARSQAQQRRCEFEDLLDAIAQEVQKAVAAVETSQELVAFYQDEGLPLAEDNVEAAQRAFQAGEQSIIVLMEAQKSLVAQRAEYVNAQRDYAIALADLQSAIGGRIPRSVPTEPATTQPSGYGETAP